MLLVTCYISVYRKLDEAKNEHSNSGVDILAEELEKLDIEHVSRSLGYQDLGRSNGTI